jgi:DNA-binding Xre family transcriptional regulator
VLIYKCTEELYTTLKGETNMKHRETVADRVRVYLYKNRITQKELAEQIGMNKNTLSAKLNQKIKISVDELEQMCGVLGCDPNEFMRRAS